MCSAGSTVDAHGIGNDPPPRTEFLHTASARPRSSRPARNVHRQVTSLAVRFSTAGVPCFTTRISNSTACPSRNVPLHDPEIALAATNISWPPAVVRKRIPFSALNHLTTPVVRSASAGVERPAIVNKTKNVLNIAIPIDRLPIGPFDTTAYRRVNSILCLRQSAWNGLTLSNNADSRIRQQKKAVTADTISNRRRL